MFNWVQPVLSFIVFLILGEDSADDGNESVIASRQNGSTFLASYVLLLLMIFKQSCGNTQTHLSKVINEALQSQVKLSAINFIVDWSSQSQHDVLHSISIPLSIFEADLVTDKYKNTKKVCPIVIPFRNMRPEDDARLVRDDEIIPKRKDMTISDTKQPLTVVIWVSLANLGIVLQYIEDTVMWCHQSVDMGLLDLDTKFIFVTDGINGTSTIFRETVLQSAKRIKTHPKVIVLESREVDVVFKSYNTYSKRNNMPQIETTVLSPAMQSVQVNHLFPTINYLNGKKLRVIHALFAHYIQATFLPQGGNPNNRLTGHYGLVPDFLAIFSHHYNASIEFLHPESIFDYGGIMDDGSWSGQVRMLWDGTGDTTCELANNYGFRQISLGHGYGDPEYLSFASPKYVVKSKTFALLKPFNLLVWILVVAMIIFIMPIVLYIFGLKYHVDSNSSPMQILYDLIWFSFSIFLGEVKVSDLKIVSITQRGLLGSWLFFSMIMGFAYSGTLKSHLMTVESVPPIDSLSDIVQSSLRVKLAVYDDVYDQELATTMDPVRSRLWAMHEPLQEYRGPLTDVEKGEAVNINWKSHLNAMIKIHHSTTDGTALIHLGDDPILFKTYLTCNYTPDKPWGPQLGRFIRGFEAAGLFHYLKEKALRRLRREERNEDRIISSPFLDSTCPEGACPLGLEHFVGTGIILGICLGSSLICFLSEKFLSYFVERKTRNVTKFKRQIIEMGRRRSKES